MSEEPQPPLTDAEVEGLTTLLLDAILTSDDPHLRLVECDFPKCPICVRLRASLGLVPHEWDENMARCQRCGITHELVLALAYECGRSKTAAECVEGRYTGYPNLTVVRI